MISLTVFHNSILTKAADGTIVQEAQSQTKREFFLKLK